MAPAPVMWLLLLLVFSWNGVDASFRVVVPVREDAGDIDHKLALFGRPTYGGSLVAPLVLAPASNLNACQIFTADEMVVAVAQQHLPVASDNDVDGGKTEPFVLLVARGGCHFVQKARNAQATGAVALVVYDTGDDDAKLPVLADDGSGEDIHIPSLLIHHKHGQELTELLANEAKTIVALTWDVPHPDDRVEVALWLSSRSSPQLHAFIDRFRPVIKALGDRVLFTPFYDVHVGSAWGCSGRGTGVGPVMCPKLCVYDGAFCTYDPEKNNTVGLDGVDVLEEDVRQLCVYKHAQATSNTSALYWDYLVAFNKKCSVAHATSTEFNEQCSQSVQQELGIPSLSQCADDVEAGKTILQAQVDALNKFHVMEFPELTVNDVPLYGGIECDEPISLSTCAPLKMICAGFQEGTTPPACHASYWSPKETLLGACVAPKEIDECGVCNSRGAPEWNSVCMGCDGVPNSGVAMDACGFCAGSGSFDACGRCLPADDPSRDKSCLDCKGVPNGFATRDACGMCDGHGSFDACGLCLDASDPRRQNFACHVMEDPDAVVGKLEIQGIHMKQFRGEMLTSFQKAVGFVVDVPSDHVLVKTVDDAVAGHLTASETTMVLFFVACEDAACRSSVAKKLEDPSAALAVAIKMKSVLNNDQYGLQTSQLIEHVALHSVGDARAALLTTATGSDPTQRSSKTWVGVTAACVMTLAIGFVLLRVRDERLRRDFRELFARYTPLTAMDYEEEEHSYGHPGGGGGAEAW